MPTFPFLGESIHYQKHGDGPTLILVHGAGGSAMNWPPALRRLPGWQVIAIDLPGHGKSAAAAPLRATADFAALVLACADQVGASRFAVAGQSLGAAVALQLAVDAPQRVSHLILINGAAQIEVNPLLLTALQGGESAIYTTLTRLSYARTTPPERLARYEAHLRKTSAPALWGAFYACSQFDVRARVGEVRMPVLLLAAAKDKMIPVEASAALAALLPDAQLQIVPDAGHMIHIEAPAVTTSAIAAFLAERTQ